MKDFLRKVNNIATEKFAAQYSEARAQNLSKTMFTMKEGRVEAAKQSVESGVALRVLVNGAWGFASVGSLQAGVLAEAISDACAMAKAASLRLKTPIKLAPTKPVEDRVETGPRRTPRK